MIQSQLVQNNTLSPVHKYQIIVISDSAVNLQELTNETKQTSRRVWQLKTKKQRHNDTRDDVGE